MHLFQPETDVTWYNEILRDAWRLFWDFFVSAVKGKTPQVGDRVLVEAVYNPNMPFKWNAQRIQTLPQLANQSVRTPSSAQLLMKEKITLLCILIQRGVFCLNFYSLFYFYFLFYFVFWIIINVQLFMVDTTKLSFLLINYLIYTCKVDNGHIIVLFTFVKESHWYWHLNLGSKNCSNLVLPKMGNIFLALAL